MLDFKLEKAIENRDKNRIIFMKRVLKAYAQRIINEKTRAKETKYYDCKLSELNKRRDN